MWVEHYKNCSCSSEAKTKEELLGQCKTHGNSFSKQYMVDEETPVKVKKSNAERYTIRIPGSWWADITMSADGFLNIQSDYGNYGYCWGSFGDDFKKFLMECDSSYLYGKLGGQLPREFNLKKSLEEVRRQILQDRREDNYDSKTCRVFWEATEVLKRCGHFTDANDWYREVLDSDLARYFQDDPSAIPCITDRNYQLGAFLDLIWPIFMNILRKEKTAEQFKVISGEKDEQGENKD